MKFEQILAQHPERRCDTGRGVVAWREAGDGEPVMLLHGISSGAASWVLQLAGLGSGKRRVLAWDAPGYGNSTPLADVQPRAGDYANALIAWLDALALDNVTLVGHSLGALMAAAVASAQPDRIRQLVLMSPARGYAKADAQEREGRFARRMAMLDDLGPDGLARERAPALLSSQASAEAVAWVANNMRRLNPAAYRQAARMLADDDIGRYACGYAKSVTVFSGAADTITPVEKCRGIAAEFASARYESVPGLGHALYIEAGAQINDLLRRQFER